MKYHRKLAAGLIIFAMTFLTSTLVLSSKETGQATEKKTETQEEKKKKKDAEKKEEKKVPMIQEEIIVTATRIETKVFDVPGPVSVVNSQKIQENAPNNASELLPEMPGMDIVGVGANQSRPVIRGLRGQRILLLSDGVRLSNSRRSQDFGEIPALIDIFTTDRLEVVRGPSSVLYGSDAIGGVINIISRAPLSFQGRTSISGSWGYRYGSADRQQKAFANLSGNIGGLGFMLSGSYRNSRDYVAPAGNYGDITLNQDTPVRDSGVKDGSFNVLLGYRLKSNDFSLKYENYTARNAGFGYVEPAAYSPGDPSIQLLYPEQDWERLTLRYENRALNFPLADGITWTGYRVANHRLFDTNITINFFPGAGLNILSANSTDITTLGTRLELTKILFGRHILVYGMDFYQDESKNSDSSSTTIFGFGPPQTSTSTLPNIPNADFRSLGLFVQDQWSLFPRATLVLGLRHQSNSARTKDTPGLPNPAIESRDKTFVGAANLIYGLAENLNLILSAGRGFRSPNLTERFFEGITPDGSGYQIRTPDLKAETSLNLETGLRYKLGGLYLESSYFHNTVYDGIAIVAAGGTFGRLPKYKNVNIDRLRFQGVEILGQYDWAFGLSLGANYTYLKSKNLTNPELPYTDTFGSRLNANVRYTVPGDVFWVEYALRLSGARKDVDLGVNPLGPIIPGFVTHTLRGGITLFKTTRFPQQIGVIVGNLTNALYSEISNASFFRPAPKRHVILTWSSRF